MQDRTRFVHVHAEGESGFGFADISFFLYLPVVEPTQGEPAVSEILDRDGLFDYPHPDPGVGVDMGEVALDVLNAQVDFG